MNTYQETVNRYRILRHDDLPETHKAELRLHDIDPDDLWSLTWSFETLEDAEEKLSEDINRAAEFGFKRTYKIVDNGEASTIERPVW